MPNNFTISSGSWYITSDDNNTTATTNTSSQEYFAEQMRRAQNEQASYKGYYTIPLTVPKKVEDLQTQFKKCCKQVFKGFELTEEDLRIMSEDCERILKEMPGSNYKTVVMTVAQSYLEFKLNSETFEENNLLDEVKAFLKEGK